VPYLTDWRRATCGDLTSAFGFGEPADSSVPMLPETQQALQLVEQRIAGLPKPSAPSIQTMPKPEAATIVRRRRPLPA
jgi:phospholipase C